MKDGTVAFLKKFFLQRVQAKSPRPYAQLHALGFHDVHGGIEDGLFGAPLF